MFYPNKDQTPQYCNVMNILYIDLWTMYIYLCLIQKKKSKIPPPQEPILGGSITTAENSCSKRILGMLLKVPKPWIKFFPPWIQVFEIWFQSPYFSHDLSGTIGKRTFHHQHKCNSVTEHEQGHHCGHVWVKRCMLFHSPSLLLVGKRLNMLIFVGDLVTVSQIQNSHMTNMTHK